MSGPGVVAHWRGSYCSRACAFWAKVDQSDAEGCWTWVGYIGADGYGLFTFHGQTEQAHREAWRQLRGPIPDGLWVLHDCPGAHNKACVRHTYLGTHADNTRDAVTLGQVRRGDQHGLRLHPERAARGAQHGSARLTVDQVVEIRRLAASGRSRRSIATLYPVSFQTVSRIVRGELWPD